MCVPEATELHPNSIALCGMAGLHTELSTEGPESPKDSGKPSYRAGKEISTFGIYLKMSRICSFSGFISKKKKKRMDKISENIG